VVQDVLPEKEVGEERVEVRLELKRTGADYFVVGFGMLVVG
jgi:hypothetical protein